MDLCLKLLPCFVEEMVQSRGEVVQVIVCSPIHDLPVLQEGCCGLEEWGGLP